MKYSVRNVRRQDRLLTEQRSLEILEEAEYGVLSLSDRIGEPYCIPVNHIFDGKNSVYIHCAPEGKKLSIIRENNKVCFCVIGRVKLQPSKFTTEYESVLLKGSAHINLSEQERRTALQMLVDKLSPQYKEIGAKYIEKSFHRTEVIRVDFTEVSGKGKFLH